MAQPNTPIILPKKSQEGLLEFTRQCFQQYNSGWNFRDSMRSIDLSYQRELDYTKEHQRAKTYNRAGDPTRLQNITIPIVLPQVESAVTYQASVFLTGTPLFGVVASPEFEDEALQLESLIEENSVRGGWVRQLMLFFRDGAKYNLSALEVDWCREVTANLETDISFGKQGRPKEIIWEGNRIKRLDMYNFVFDSRVTPTELHTKGEFAAYTELMSRVQLKAFINSLPDKLIENVTAAFESGAGNSTNSYSDALGTYYVPDINSEFFASQDTPYTTNWESWAGLAGASQKIKYKNMYQLTTLYGRIIPSDFGLKVPSSNTPQIWKFYIVNNSVIIYAERLTNAHGYIPILIGQPLEDGLGHQTKSLAANVRPIQEVSSTLMNSAIAARRRAVSDRVLYNPMLISEHHINSDNPSAKIPVRPAAYNRSLQEAVYAFPFRDDQSGIILQELGQITGLANHISGQNPVRQGQFVKGNKTLHEFQDVMSNANGRDQMTAMLYESQVFTPLKEILKLNYLQYQGGTSVYNREKTSVVSIDPVALRKAVLEFKISDGLTPVDKLINADILQVAMQVIGSSPQIGAGYNLAPLFSYVMKTQGAHLKSFEKSPEQIAYEQALNAWQQTIMQLFKNNPEIKPEQLPPQPVPEQYGYMVNGEEQQEQAQGER